MAKRFSDSTKWDDPFFSDLSNDHKLLWIYMLDKCDHAGIFKVNKRLAEFCLNAKFDWKEVEGVFKGRIQPLNHEKWFISKFIEYQYGTLTENNRVHNSIMQILKKEGVLKGLQRTVQARKDKDKDKDKDKVKDKDRYSDFVLLTKKEHQTLYNLFGESQAKDMIEKLNNYIGSKGKQYKSHYFTILNWAGKDGIRRQTITKAPDYIKDFKEPNAAEQKKVNDLVKSTIGKMGQKK